MRASVSVRSGGGLTGRLLAEATGALLSAGALAGRARADRPRSRSLCLTPHPTKEPTTCSTSPRPWSTRPPAVAATAVTRRYGDGESAVDALRGVSLEVPAGQFTAVMGPSGSGKSTLMHLLAGLDRPTAGTVEIGGEDITAMNDKQLTKLRRKHIGFVFQRSTCCRRSPPRRTSCCRSRSPAARPTRPTSRR